MKKEFYKKKSFESNAHFKSTCCENVLYNLYSLLSMSKMMVQVINVHSVVCPWLANYGAYDYVHGDVHGHIQYIKLSIAIL